MTLYRVLERLVWDSGRRLPMGAIDSLKKVPPNVIAMLLKKNRITEVHPPPLAILPGWKKRAGL